MAGIVQKAEKISEDLKIKQSVTKKMMPSCREILHLLCLVMSLNLTSFITFACGLELRAVELYPSKTHKDFSFFETFCHIHKEVTILGLFAISAMTFQLLLASCAFSAIRVCLGAEKVPNKLGSGFLLLNVVTGFVFYLISEDCSRYVAELKTSPLTGIFFIRTNWVGLFVYVATVLLTVATSGSKNKSRKKFRNKSKKDNNRMEKLETV